MGCGTQLVKYILFFFNFLFVVAGILLITGGALSYAGYDKYLDLAKEVELDAYKAPPILMMVIGSIVFLIAFLGCCGAMQESNCMMMTYGFVLICLLIAEIGIAVVAHVYRDDFEKVLKEGFFKSMQRYGPNNDEAVTEGWDSMQQNLKCCGVDMYTDWKDTTWTVPEDLVPKSCCLDPSVDYCSKGVINLPLASERIYTEGCLKKAMNDIGIKYIIIGAAVVGAIELLGIIFACCLAGRFRNKRYTV